MGSRLSCLRSSAFFSDITSDIEQGDSENRDVVPEVKIICRFRQREFT
jgi:hypothetical protein